MDGRVKPGRAGWVQDMRFRSLLFPLLACGVGGYFAYHLQTGDHGLQARADLEKRKAVLAGELAGLERGAGSASSATLPCSGPKASTRTCWTSAPAPFRTLPIPTISVMLKRRAPAETPGLRSHADGFVAAQDQELILWPN